MKTEYIAPQTEIVCAVTDDVMEIFISNSFEASGEAEAKKGEFVDDDSWEDETSFSVFDDRNYTCDNQ